MSLARWWVKHQIKRQLKARGLCRAERKAVMTAGMKSSEFWMSVLAVLFKWLGPHLGMDFPNEAFYAVASYAVGRGLAKFKKA